MHWAHLFCSLAFHVLCLGLFLALAEPPKQEEVLFHVSLSAGVVGGAAPFSSTAGASSAGRQDAPTATATRAPAKKERPAAQQKPQATPKKAASRPASQQALAAQGTSPARRAAVPQATSPARAAAPPQAAFPALQPSVTAGQGETAQTGGQTGGGKVGQTGGQAGGQGTPEGTTHASGVFAAHQVDKMPSVTRRVVPRYPSAAKKEGIEGRVVVRLVVDTSGMPGQCSINNASPQGYFEEAALQAAHKMRFTPGEKAGKPVKTLVLLPFEFRLR